MLTTFLSEIQGEKKKRFIYLIIGLVCFVIFLQIDYLKPYLLSFLPMAALLTVISLIIRSYNLYPSENANKLTNLFFILSLVSNLLVFSFVQREKFIYFWDFSAYWNSTILFSDLYFNNFTQAVKQVYISILNDDYNVVPILPIMFIFKLSGGSYESFVLSILNLYILPFIILFTLFMIKAFNIGSHKGHIFLLMGICFFPALLSPLLSGYLDSIGLLFIGLLLVILYNKKQEELSLKDILLLSFLLIALALSRRWYSYWVVGFFSAIFIAEVLKLLFIKTYLFKNFIRTISKFFYVGIFCVLILAVFFNGFLVRTISNNYSYAYSAYKLGGVMEIFEGLIRYHGFFYFILILIGFVFGVTNHKFRYISTVLGIQAVVVFILFTRVQSFAIHHYYLFTATFLFFFCLGCYFIVNLLKQSTIKSILAVIILGLVYLNFSNAFISSSNSGKLLGKASIIYGNYKLYPRVRDDIPQLTDLTRYLNELTVNTSKRVYVLSSSGILNDDIIRKLEMPEKLDALPSMFVTHHVDKRDGFPEEIFESEYLVVADPIQYHLRPEDQQVIGIISSSLLNQDIFGKNYKVLKEFSLSNQVKAKVFQRQTELNAETKGYVKDLFKQQYANDPLFFK
ncbi:hypothetical protein [Paenibacillus sp. GbtcB18]|uniref:hypothetical protein n=1 Tax=Paenibacillus sp. GbtcB18 TaxID=2824763 RepID=UPI001C3070E4|nr:hypothetical protein [Paenibacillus sp. GbtcB18]